MEGKVLLQDLAQSLATKRNIKSKDAELFLKAFFETISAGILQDKIVKIKGLGTFKMIEVQERESVNVNTGERIVIPGHSKISFTPDTELKEQVNKPFALFQTVVINEGTSLEDMEKLDGSMLSDSFQESELMDKQSVLEVPTIPMAPDGLVAASEQEISESPEIQEVSEVKDVTIESKLQELPQDSDNVLTSTLHTTHISPKKPEWWYISSAMLALLFAFFWIVFLVGYLLGSYNLFNINPFVNKPVHESFVMVDTVFVERNTEPDTMMIHAIEDSLRNVIREENKTDKEQPLVTVPKPVKTTTISVSDKKQVHTYYEIIGQKGVRRIKWGDYLLKIVREEYGNEDALKYVISYNKFADPNNLPIGTEIKLPKLREK